MPNKTNNDTNNEQEPQEQTLINMLEGRVITKIEPVIIAGMIKGLLLHTDINDEKASSKHLLRIYTVVSNEEAQLFFFH